MSNERISTDAIFTFKYIFRLPTLISQIHYDVDEIKARLNISIQNIHGINTNLFTPHVAFVAVAKTQIEKLREPIAVCINLVLDELLIAIRLCTKHVSV